MRLIRGEHNERGISLVHEFQLEKLSVRGYKLEQP